MRLAEHLPNCYEAELRQADVAGFEAEKKAKTLQREKDNKAFIAESTDYGESLDALERAIVVLMLAI